MANNREISQFAGLVTVNDSTNQVSIGASFQLTGGGHIGIGSDVTENYIDATGPIKGTRFSAGDTPQGDSGLSLRAHGGGTNYGLLEGEGNTISFSGARNNDGAVGSMAYIKNVAEGDLGASWPNALTFGVRRFGSTFEALRITSEGYTRLTTANARLEWIASSGSNPFIRSIGTDQQELEFNTSGDERLRITSDGYVRLASTSSGIQFNGDTAAANALDDYEEGTFSPSWANLTGGSILGQTGRYIKIGTQVWCVAAAKNNSSVSGADASTATFTLPFAPLQSGSFADYVQNIGTAYVGTAGGAGGGSSTNQSTYLAYNRNSQSTVNLRSGTVTIPIKGFLIITMVYNAAS